MNTEDNPKRKYTRSKPFPTYREIATKVGTTPATVNTADLKFVRRLVDSILREPEHATELLLQLTQEIPIDAERLAKIMTEDQKRRLADLI